MPIEAIGATLSNSNSAATANSSLSQDDFLRLFLTELNFQDPLEPVDNKEFLAQIAQFSAIEQNRQTAEKIENLVLLSSTQQSVDLLNKKVEIQSTAGPMSGDVTAIKFSTDGALLTVKLSDGSIVTDVRLSQISLILTSI